MSLFIEHFFFFLGIKVSLDQQQQGDHICGNKLINTRTSPLMPICTICKDNMDPKKNAIQNAKLYKKIQGCKRYAPR